MVTFQFFCPYRYGNMSRIDVNLYVRKESWVFSAARWQLLWACGQGSTFSCLRIWQYVMDVRICVCKANCVAFVPYDMVTFRHFRAYRYDNTSLIIDVYLYSICSFLLLPLFLQISHSISIRQYILWTKGSHVSFGVVSLHRLCRHFLPLFAGIVSSSGNPFSYLPNAQIWHWP